jgi:hypothetical protein
MNKDEIISKAKSILETDSSVVAAYLFGSLAKGTEHPMSDIDIAILTAKSNPDSIVSLTRKLTIMLSEKLGSLKVDLVILNGADLTLRYDVVKDGFLFFERDSTERVRFERETIVEYIDMVPLWEIYDYYMLRRIKEKTPVD